MTKVNKEPFVSIILPTYNGEHLEFSVNSVINQSYKNWELIIIDDGSNLTFKNKISRMQKLDSRIKVITNKTNMKLIKSLNVGLEAAKGKYIARIDDDDIWTDEKKLEYQIKFLEDNTEYGIVGCNAQKFGEKKNEYIVAETDLDIRKNILVKNQFIHSAIVFRKEKWKYDYNSELVEDYDLWLRILLKMKGYNIQKKMVRYYARSKSLSKKYKYVQIMNSLKLSINYSKYSCFQNRAFQLIRAIISNLIRIVR